VQQPDEHRMVAVVVEAAARVLADVVPVAAQHWHGGGDPLEFLRQHDREQLFLAAEVVVDPLLVHPGAARDALDPRPGQAALGELLHGGRLELRLGLLDVPRHVRRLTGRYRGRAASRGQPASRGGVAVPFRCLTW
jgi:hypothetical protein